MRSACLAALLLSAALAPWPALALAAQPPFAAAGHAEHTVTYHSQGFTDCRADLVVAFAWDPATRVGTLRGASPGPQQASCPFLGETYFPGQCAPTPGGGLACSYAMSWASDGSHVRSSLALGPDGSLWFEYTYTNDTPQLPSYHRRVAGPLLRV